MNVYAFETKAQARTFFIWCPCLLALFLLLVNGFYGAFVGGKDAVQKALTSLPPAFAIVFGIYLDRFFSFGGFFQFVYTYVGLMGAIMASSIALSAFSREKRSRCTDFLFAKPVTRGRLFTVKLLACLTPIIATGALFVGAALMTFATNGQDMSGASKVALAASSLLFTQLVFMSASALYAVCARKVRSVSGTATAFGFAGFMLMALQSLTREAALRYLSPLNYFNPDTVFATGGFEGRYVLAGAIVMVACLAVAYVRYCKSDTQVV